METIYAGLRLPERVFQSTLTARRILGTLVQAAAEHGLHEFWRGTPDRHVAILKRLKRAARNEPQLRKRMTALKSEHEAIASRIKS